MGSGSKFLLGAACIVAIGFGGWFGGRAAIERIVHDYILANPEILPEAMENLQQKQAEQALSGIRPLVETPFPGAVLGNPQGKVTMVEYTDFACGFCRQSLPDVQALIARNPDLRIVVRELPIIGPHSPDAAKMALAAAEQGKYQAFHDAMFAAGQVDPETIEAIAGKVGLDMERARKTAASKAVADEINRNLETASRLGFSGTPSWIVGNRLISGAVGVDRLAEALTEARGNEGA